MTRNEAKDRVVEAARRVLAQYEPHEIVDAESKLRDALILYDSTPDSEGGSVIDALAKRSSASRQYPNAIVVLFANSPDRESFYEALSTLPAPPSQEQK